jgi:hypothetical protein
VEWIIVPYNQERIRGNECSILVSPGPMQIFNIWENLNSQTVQERYVYDIWRPIEERINNIRANGHSSLQGSAR